MDFHTLSRKELQTLCKINKIPANTTNVAMADALAALQQVEGLDELFNPKEHDFQEDKVVGTPDIHRTACRTSTRRKAVREGEETESSKVNVPVTPAMPSSRRRAPAVSTRRKKELQIPEEDEKNGVQGKPTDVPKTPAPPTSRTRASGRSVCRNVETPDGTAVQRAYNTRRSVRLLEKNLSQMSLMDSEGTGLREIGDISEDMSNGSRQIEDLAENEKFTVSDVGPSLPTVSTVVSEKTDEFDVTSGEKNAEYELVSGAEKDVGASLQAEPHDSNLTLEGRSETYNDSNEVCKRCDESDVDLNKSIGKPVHAANEAENKKCQGIKQDASLEVSEDQAVEESEDASIETDREDAALPVKDSCDSSEPENKKCLVTMQDASIEVSEDKAVEESGDASLEVIDQDDAALPIEDSCDSSEPENKKCPGTKQDVSIEVSEDKSVEESEDASMEMEVRDRVDAAMSVEGSCNFSEPENKKRLGTKQNASIEVSKDKAVEESEDASLEVTDQDAAAMPGEVPMEVTDQGFACLLPVSSVSNDSIGLKELVAFNPDNQDDNDSAEISALSVEVPEDSSAEDTDKDSDGLLPVSSVSNDSVNLKELVACNNDNQDGIDIDSAEISDALVSGLTCKINVLVDGDVIPEEIPTPKRESLILAETMKQKTPSIEVSADNIDEVKRTMIVAPINGQKTSDIPIQSVVSDQPKGESHYPAELEAKGVTNEILTAPKMKENPNTDELQKYSIRQLKKQLKNLTLDGKSNSKNNNVAKEVDRKRTVLQVLSENRMTASEAQNAG